MYKIFEKFFVYSSPDAKTSPSPTGGEVSSGRSMIEMLGVLAIIAVLSVGGIAGYSKVMQKWKENKQIEQVTGLIYNVLDLEYNFAADFRKEQTNILDGLYLLKQLNRLPDGITLQNNRVAVDTFGNYYDFVYYGGLCGYEQLPCEGMYFFMQLAKNSSGITLPAKIQCQNIIKIVSKFDSENYNIRRLEFRDDDVKNELGDPTTKAIIRGKSNCIQNSKCFSNISLDEAYNFCKLCESSNCALVLYMGR